jgi:hypothetical protein
VGRGRVASDGGRPGSVMLAFDKCNAVRGHIGSFGTAYADLEFDTRDRPLKVSRRGLF